MNWDEIRKEFETSKVTLKTLAEKYDVKIGTLKSRKSREGWTRDPTKKDATKKQKVATSNQKDATKKERVINEYATSEVTLDNFLEDSDLTEKQRLFCLYYVRSFNATQSAINAGYSKVTAHVQGPRLLGNVKVREEIKRVKQHMTNELFIEAVDVLNKYIKIAFSDITDYLTFGQREVPVMGAFGPVKDEDGNQVMKEVNYVDFKDSGFVDGTIISEVKQGKDGVSIKLEDRKWALDKLDRYFDLLPDHFKRRIEEEKLKIAHHKAFGANEEEEYEDDGFEAALNATTSEVWKDDHSTEEES
ncbi:terminase small subunit [Cytobacillus firmus]|uniref:terminase small subunit n=1 Tax=Cytobacillus firmus TaxID=1399 RepID=UPI00237BC84E|nr:terminase small subunit [Cytobacillus firmus]MDD9312654.1 terminase small subunit [Cytobacillus firmus]